QINVDVHEFDDDTRYLQQFEFLELPKEPTGLEVYRGWRKLAKASKSPINPSMLIVSPAVENVSGSFSPKDSEPKEPERLTSSRRYDADLFLSLLRDEETKHTVEWAIQKWEDANSQTRQELYSLLKAGRLDPYATAEKMIQNLLHPKEGDRLALSSIGGVRRTIKRLLKFMEIPGFKEELFDSHVTKVKSL